MPDYSENMFPAELDSVAVEDITNDDSMVLQKASETKKVHRLSISVLASKVTTWLAVSNSILYVSADCIADGIRTFNTIAAACSAWTSGKVIMLAPETFAESVTLDRAGMEIIGQSPEATIVTNINITAKDCVAEGLTISGDLIIVDTVDAYSFTQWIRIESVILLGNVSVGTESIKNIYNVHFINCQARGNTKYFIINCNRFYFNNGIIQNNDSAVLTQYSFSLYAGIAYFRGCTAVVIQNLSYMSPLVICYLQFDFSIVQIVGILTTQTANSAYHNLIFRSCSTCGVYGGVSAKDTTWTINGMFELDIINTPFYYPNIVFNSTASSRIVGMVGMGSGNTSIITGTGLSKLYIKLSSFGCAAPSGLGEDIGNVWSSFIDN